MINYDTSMRETHSASLGLGGFGQLGLDITRGDIPSFLDPVLILVDQTIQRLSKRKFISDPIVDEKYSRITSIVSSAYKRHGNIIEHALVRTLQQALHLDVWCDAEFRVPESADRLADSDANAIGADLRYSPNVFVRTLQVDLMVYNRNTHTIGAYESKRGFGYHDSGKKRSMLRDMRCMRMLLKSYAQTMGKHADSAEAHMIFYYGQCSLGAPWALTRGDLDDHFGADVERNIEIVNSYFRRSLDVVLSSV